jgi:uncharacterized protein
MKRFLFLLLIGIALYLLFVKRPLGGKSGRQTNGKPGATKPEAMVSCAYCKLHVPLSDSIVAGDNYYCGEEHRRLDARKQDT